VSSRVELHKPSFVEEEEGTALVLSVLDCRCCATCWGRDHGRVCNWCFERSPPHLFLYLFLFKRKTKVETTRTLPVLNTGESKLYSNKKWEVLEAPDFIFIFYYFFCKDNLGYLPAVLGLWSQARPWEFILQLLMLMRFPASPPLWIYHCSSCKVSAQIQQRALHRYYDKQNQIQPS